MAEVLAEHLAALPEPQLNRIASSVIGGALGNRAMTERAIAQRLLDSSWVGATMHRLGKGAHAALAALFNAGVPVLRRDVAALLQGRDEDSLEELEEHGLATPVRTGRGMPTHITITPGMEALVGQHVDAAQVGTVTDGLLHAGARRRFELAVMVAIVGQHSPRLTREGRLHARDLKTLTDRLDPLGHRVASMEGRLARWHEVGAAAPNMGRLCVVPEVATDIPQFHQRLAMNELAAPSLPDGALAAVRVLLVTQGAMPLRAVLEAAQTELLRDRAGADEELLKRGAKRELLDVMSALLGLECVVLLDASGHPLLGKDQELFQRAAEGEALGVALDPIIAAALRGAPAPAPVASTGHVQSSFEIIADVSCDPSLIACIGLCSRVMRADRAAVLQLEREAVTRGQELGVTLEALLGALTKLSGRPVPMNVWTVLRDWFGAASQPSSLAMPLTDLTALRDLALAALNRS